MVATLRTLWLGKEQAGRTRQMVTNIFNILLGSHSLHVPWRWAEHVSPVWERKLKSRCCSARTGQSPSLLAIRSPLQNTRWRPSKQQHVHGHLQGAMKAGAFQKAWHSGMGFSALTSIVSSSSRCHGNWVDSTTWFLCKDRGSHIEILDWDCHRPDHA